MNTSSSCADTDSSDTSDTYECQTPKKRRQRSRTDGLNRKRASYYNSLRRVQRTNSVSTSMHRPSSSELSSEFEFQDSLSPVHAYPNSKKETSTSSDLSSDISINSDDSSTPWTTDACSATSSNDSVQIQNLNTDDDGSDNEREQFDRPLYDGCCHTKLSLYTSLVMCVNKHSMTRDAFSDVLAIIASLDKSWGIATSVYKVKEIMKTCVKLQKPEIHLFCENCQAELKNSSDTCSCLIERKVLEYSNLNVEKQIKELFKGN